MSGLALPFLAASAARKGAADEGLPGGSGEVGGDDVGGMPGQGCCAPGHTASSSADPRARQPLAHRAAALRRPNCAAVMKADRPLPTYSLPSMRSTLAVADHVCIGHGTPISGSPRDLPFPIAAGADIHLIGMAAVGRLTRKGGRQEARSRDIRSRFQIIHVASGFALPTATRRWQGEQHLPCRIPRCWSKRVRSQRMC